MDPYRLPRSVIPVRYDLRLEPDLERASFAGEVAIEVSVNEAVNVVHLNAAELAIDDAVFLPKQGPNVKAAVSLEPDAERAVLNFPQPLPLGHGAIYLHFHGTLNDKLRGFYRSRYKGADGEWRWLAATQFEATDARRAFPCWDEPAFKAVFATTLAVPEGMQAVSNTRVVGETVRSGTRTVRFADTIPMSTYLVAFVVGELEATDPVMVGATPVRVWCVPGKKHLTAFGHDVAVSSLRYFEDYFGRPYPSDKLDLIAIPDFAAGAMENLGAITFRETALLVDEAAATHQEKERVADVVAHENAHMWFGDLVTMEWWNGLWLNEAFATFMEMLAVDAYRPAWQRWTTFGVSRQAALNVDALHSSRPVEFEVKAPADAEAMFDVLTYEKGASVLRMLEQYAGPEIFRAGVREYLARHAFGSTQTGDLWRSLGAASGLPITAIMDGWVFRPGYPLIEADFDDAEELILRQRRFTYLPAEGEAPPWQVPVQVRVETEGKQETRRVLLTGERQRVPMPGRVKRVLVNAGGHGFYRVRYGRGLLGWLLDRLGSLEAIERFNLVNDAWATVLAGLTPIAEYLDLTSRFLDERDHNVWSVITGSFAYLSRVIDDEDRPALQSLVRHRVGPALAELSWRPRDGEGELTAQLRGDLLRVAGTLGDALDVQAEAARVFGNEPDANVAAAAVAVLAHAGDESRYEDFLSRFRSAKTPQEEQRYLLALAGFRSEALVARTLPLSLDGTVRTQDAPLLLRALLTSTHGRAQAWAFFKENWDRLSATLPGPGLRRLCEGVLGLARADWERDVIAYFRDRNITLGGKTLEQFLEQLRVAVLLREREGAALREYLSRSTSR